MTSLGLVGKANTAFTATSWISLSLWALPARTARRIFLLPPRPSAGWRRAGVGRWPCDRGGGRAHGHPCADDSRRLAGLRQTGVRSSSRGGRPVCVATRGAHAVSACGAQRARRAMHVCRKRPRVRTREPQVERYQPRMVSQSGVRHCTGEAGACTVIVPVAPPPSH